MPVSLPKIRIAISGGGLAGALLMFTLLQHEHLDVHIFESAASFRTSGMALGLARNATQALRLIGPAAVQCFERAGAVPQHGVRFMVATGPDAGKLIDATRPRSKLGSPTSIVHRAAFLQELLDGIPPERMHVSKKLVDIDQPVEGGEVTLRFEDGTSHFCDMLVGADGIHSTVRKMILGNTDPAAHAVYSGWRCSITLQPYEKMRSILGPNYVDHDDPFEYGWAGHGTYMMHDVLSAGNVVQFVVAMCSDGDNDKRPVAEVKETSGDWPSHLKDALAEIVGKEETVSLYGLWHHLPAATFVNGQVCMIGDAAHATTPWQGSGGGMSVEDVLVLSSLLGRVKSPREINMALLVYDDARRLRTQRVVESSYETGLIFTGQHAQFPLTLDSLNGKLPSRWNHIMEFDNARAVEEALQKSDEKLHGEHASQAS